jgi:hypothetical protein
VALGYCAVCDKLVTLRPGGRKWDGGKQVHWYPIAHLNGDQKWCTGDKKSI